MLFEIAPAILLFLKLVSEKVYVIVYLETFYSDHFVDLRFPHALFDRTHIVVIRSFPCEKHLEPAFLQHAP